MGDFNCVLNVDERLGSAVRVQRFTPFRRCKCEVHDMKQTRNFFTWTNKQEGSKRVYSKIDRVLVNERWGRMFENAEVCYMNEGDFDHYLG